MKFPNLHKLFLISTLENSLKSWSWLTLSIPCMLNVLTWIGLNTIPRSSDAVLYSKLWSYGINECQWMPWTGETTKQGACSHSSTADSCSLWKNKCEMLKLWSGRIGSVRSSVICLIVFAQYDLHFRQTSKVFLTKPLLSKGHALSILMTWLLSDGTCKS